MEERAYPETIEYDRSAQELRNYKIYGNQRQDDLQLNGSIIKHSLQEALRAYVMSLRKGVDCSTLYDKVLRPAFEALLKVNPEEEQEIKNCMICMANGIQISPEQYKKFHFMLEDAGKNLLFIMEYLPLAGMDTFDIRPKYWMEPLSDEFHYKFGYIDCAKAGYKLHSFGER